MCTALECTQKYSTQEGYKTWQRESGKRPLAYRSGWFVPCSTRHRDQVPATNNERRRGQRLGIAIKFLRRTTSAAAGNGLGTAIKYLRGAEGIGLGPTAKYLQLTTNAATSTGLGISIKHIKLV